MLLAAIPKTHEPLRSALAKVTRQLLHAERLSFTHPASGEQLSFCAPVPEDMRRVTELLEAD